MAKNRPLIGITVYKGQSATGLPIAALQTAYIQAIRQAAGLPVLIPNQLSREEWMELYPRLGGILFTGGGDIETPLFNGTHHPAVAEVDEERDALEIPLLRAAAGDGKPFLGICRGLQVTNVALGGSLYTHLPDQLPRAVQHDWHEGYARSYLAHPVRIEEGSQLADLLGEPLLQVNSLHHQGIKDLSPELHAVAFAPDGLIEAVELPHHPFGLAVQWHPEWLTDQAAMGRLFAAFVEAAGR
jgi:putative glutamine amidotransferase